MSLLKRRMAQVVFNLLTICLFLFCTHTSAGNEVFTSISWENTLDFCTTSGDVVHIGDFNGDDFDDMLCHNKHDGHISVALSSGDGSFKGTSWENAMNWCKNTNDQLFIGDFNGDNRSDMLCHRTNNLKISFASKSGQFSGTNWETNSGWCEHNGAELFIDDFNRNGRSDMLCHDIYTGQKWISYANSDGTFSGTSWSDRMKWCKHAGAKLYTGDLNRDGQADIICHDSTGKLFTALNSNGKFPKSSWWDSENLRWCQPSAELSLGDFNNDGSDDVLCSDSNGYMMVGFSQNNGRFIGTDWQKDMKWCESGGGTQLFVADVDGNGGDDLICHKNNGYIGVALNQY